MSGVHAVLKAGLAANVLLAPALSPAGSIEYSTNAFSRAKFAAEFTVSSWTTDKGLPQNTVQSLLQASDGYLWIGTFEGLLRFDGQNFRLFSQQNTPAFRNHAVTALAESPGGCLWVGTPAGLLRYSDNVFEAVPLKSHPVPVRSICARKAGGIWLGTEAGPARVEGDQVFFYTNYPGYNVPGPDQHCQFRGVDAVLEDKAGTLWLGDARGLLRLRPGAGEFEFICAPDPTFGDPIGRGAHALVSDGEGAIWFGNASGLYRWKEGQITVYPPQANGFTGSLSPMLWDPEAGLWLACESGGVSRFHESRFIHYPSVTGSSEESLVCMCRDREGNLWLGSQADGLLLAQRRRLLNLTTFDGLVNNDVWSVSEGPDGSFWIGTSRGISRYAGGNFETWRPASQSSGLTPRVCNLVLADHSGAVWTSCDRGLCRILNGNIVQVSANLGGVSAPAGSVEALYEDSAHALWVGSGNLARFKDGKWDIWEPQHSGTSAFPHALPSAPVLSILRDASGDTWVGTKGGVCRLHAGRSEMFTRTNGFPADIAGPALADPDGTVWFASNRGLIRFKQPRFFLVFRRHGLVENLVYNVLEDDFGWLWLNGNRGLQRLRKQDVNDLCDGKLTTIQCLHYGTADGMLSAEGNGHGMPNSCKARDGRLWFPTTKGVVVVDPRTLKNNDVPPPVVIEQVVADGQVLWGDELENPLLAANPPAGNPTARGDPPVGPQAKSPTGARALQRDSLPWLRLGPGRARSLLIHYTANTFVSPEKARFEYQLVGHDRDWLEDRSNLRTAIYTDLRPGTYQFKLRAFNNHGVASEHDAGFKLTLAPHLYQTWPFYISCGCAALAVAGSLHLVRMAGLRRLKALEQRHALELERARIARDMHDSLGADLTKIALLAEVARQQNGAGDQHQTWERISSLAGGLVDGIGELVWATNPKHNTLDSLAAYIREYAADLFESVGIPAGLDFPARIPELEISGEMRRNLFLAVKEALTNITRHARATRVELKFAFTAPDSLHITIRDNGRGFDPERAAAANETMHGNGLKHIRQRVAAVGGEVFLDSRPGSGTTIRMQIPLEVLDSSQGPPPW